MRLISYWSFSFIILSDIWHCNNKQKAVLKIKGVGVFGISCFALGSTVPYCDSGGRGVLWGCVWVYVCYALSMMRMVWGGLRTGEAWFVLGCMSIVSLYDYNINGLID